MENMISPCADHAAAPSENLPLQSREWLCRLALTRIAGVGRVRGRILYETFGNAADIFSQSPSSLRKIKGIGSAPASAICAFRDFEKLESELDFMEKFQIRPLLYKDRDFPRRLDHNKDAPFLLFYRGNADLNTEKVISIVGTRTPTEYGCIAVEQLVKGLELPGMLIVSGLAYGIDTWSHRAALRNGIPTIGVLAHGLDRIYPAENTGLARKMVLNGGLLTQFPPGTEAGEHNFPIRNHTVAGICDALVVVETAAVGGSMLTARHARDYRKPIFTFPGRTNDPKSEGCNWLIRKGSATLITGADDLLEAMNWQADQSNGQDAGEDGRQDAGRGAGMGAGAAGAGAGVSTGTGVGAGRSAGAGVGRGRGKGSGINVEQPGLFDHIDHVPAAGPLEKKGETGRSGPGSLDGDQLELIQILRDTGNICKDELLASKRYSPGSLSLALLKLELGGYIRSLPGNRYSLLQGNR